MNRLINDFLELVSSTFYSILDVAAVQTRNKGYLIFIVWPVSLFTVLIALPLIIVSALIAYPFYVVYKIFKGESWSRF